MKYFKKLIIFLLMSIVLTACYDNTQNNITDGEDNYISGLTIQKSIVQPDMKYWKWYEYKPEGYTIYANSSTSSNPIKTFTEVQLPFFEAKGPAAKALYRLNSNDVDMFPEDGWILLAVNFGTATNAPSLPYYLLYNKATSTLRYVFFYTFNEAYTYAIVKLEQGSGVKTSIFTAMDSDNCFVEKFDKDKSLITVTDIALNEWCYADFVISYDPTVATTTDQLFYFSIYGVNEGEIKLKGELTLEEVIEKGQLHTKGIPSAGEIISAGQEAYASYQNTQEFLDFCNQDTGAWYSEMLGTMYAELLGSNILSLVPVFGGIAGIISSGIFSGLFGGKESTAVPLKFAGTITLNGTITEKNLISTFGLNVPGTQITNNNINAVTYDNNPLGVFSIKSKPVLDITITSEDRKSPTNNIKTIKSFLFNVSNIKLSNNTFPEIKFNQIEGYYIDSVEIGYVFSNETPVDFRYGTGDSYSTYERVPFRVHENHQVEFSIVENFVNNDLNYSQTYLRQWQYRRMPMAQTFEISDKIKLNLMKTVAKIVAPEIAIKVILYSVDDTEKLKPIVHLKRIRADYNLYRCDKSKYNAITNLGFYTN